MNESIKNPSESIGELFLMAYGGLDPEPALTMIRDYGISGFYLSNDNVPDRKTAQDLSLVLQEENKKNGQFLPVLSMFVGQYEVAWEDMAAAAVVTMLPPFLIALFFQRFLIRGMTLGAVK